MTVKEAEKQNTGELGGATDMVPNLKVKSYESGVVIAQKLRALVLAENEGLIPRTHCAVASCIFSSTSKISDALI